MIDIRYDNDVEIIVDPSLKDVKGYLPPVCLQLLVENAIKHNKYNDSKHLHIRLSADTENIIVENDFRPLEYATPSTGIGIKNIFSRYAILTDRKPVFLQTGEKYIVKLPIIFKKNEDTDY
jgi:two-component system, LytTR family, sensor kinase